MTISRNVLRWLIGGAAAAAQIADQVNDDLAQNGGALVPNLSTRQRAAYDRLVDALNRLPRPLMALGTLAMLAAAMFDPIWFSARMEALAAMPEPMWWLIGAVVSLHFGGRMQVYAQGARRPGPSAPVTPPVEPITKA